MCFLVECLMCLALCFEFFAICDSSICFAIVALVLDLLGLLFLIIKFGK